MGDSWSDEAARNFLMQIFRKAVHSVEPARAVTSNLPDRPRGRCIVVGAGKASAAMAAAVDVAWADVELTGLVVTRYGHALPAGRIEVLEAGHPVPDVKSVEAASRMMSAVRGLGPDDLVLALISGGGSSLLTLPAENLSLEDKQLIGRALLDCGASISEINKVRKFFSAIKGGLLAEAASPARIVTLIISDIPGDEPSLVASGPTIPESVSRADVQDIIGRYSIVLPKAAANFLDRPSIKNRRFHAAQEVKIIAKPSTALTKAAQEAVLFGVHPLLLGDSIEGESREIAKVMCGIAKSVDRDGVPIKRPAVLLSGGEATVTLTPPMGRGGRNTEFALAYALAAGFQHSTWALACDTDGIDGTEDAAGAIVCPDTLNRAASAGLDAQRALMKHDSYTFFSALGDLVFTGPTLTNVNDFRAILVV